MMPHGVGTTAILMLGHVCSSLWAAGISKLSHAHIIGKYSFGAVATGARLTTARRRSFSEWVVTLWEESILAFYNKGLRFPIC